MCSVERWVRMYDDFRTSVSDLVHARQVRGRSRACHRREWRLSPQRLAALQKRKHLEGTLERTLLWILSEKLHQRGWVNQFNPASGAGGERREAVDLVRWQLQGIRGKKDLLELKEWDAADTVVDMVDEVVRYAMLTTILHDLRVAPYDQWPQGLELHLWCIAPHRFFANRGGVSAVDNELRKLSEEWSRLQVERPSLQDVTLDPNAICLSASISKPAFCDCFDPDAVESAIQSKRKTPDPGKLLKSSRIADVKDWFSPAFSETGLLN